MTSRSKFGASLEGLQAGIEEAKEQEHELYEARFGVSVATPERQAEWAAATPAGGAMTRQ